MVTQQLSESNRTELHPTLSEWLIIGYDGFDATKAINNWWYGWHNSFYIAAIYLLVVYSVERSGIVQVFY